MSNDFKTQNDFKESTKSDYIEKFIYKNKDVFLDPFSKGIKNFLDRRNLTTREVAKILDITDSSVSSWKYGRAFPDVPNLIRLFILGLSPFEIMDKTLERRVRISDNEFKIDRNKKEIDFIKNSSISGEFMAEFSDEIQMEASAIKTKDTNYYLANELERLLEIIENAHSPDIFPDPKEQQEQIDFAHERLFIFCKAFVMGLRAKRDD